MCVLTWCLRTVCAWLLDVSDIKFVINYDFPNNTEDYIHRIGRTARAENKGTAYTFFTSQVRGSAVILGQASRSLSLSSMPNKPRN